ncbi:hypothetical protein NVP2275O_304 [Vibrio phage 2.275.O._10N.286.54.E11]|nr:hypothetical protein NVP2275O_304 [Vibrio phage 2.275.O._10N.286.54.E11]
MADFTYEDAIASPEGTTFWVCAHSRRDVTKKAQRYQEPQQAVVVSDGAVIRGSNFLVLLNNKGNMTKKKVIRTSTYIYDDKDECAARFNALSIEIRDRYMDYSRYVAEQATALSKLIDKYSK